MVLGLKMKSAQSDAQSPEFDMAAYCEIHHRVKKDVEHAERCEEAIESLLTRYGSLSMWISDTINHTKRTLGEFNMNLQKVSSGGSNPKAADNID